MANFKIIFKVEQDWGKEELPIPWAEGCPLAVEKMQISRNTETGEAYFQAKLKNISDREVLSYRANFSCSFEEGEDEEKPVAKLDADIAAAGIAEISPIKLSRSDATKASLTITEVKTAAGVWESTNEITRFPHVDDLHFGEEAGKERILQLRKTGCAVFPGIEKHQCEIHDSWWRCACGCINVGYSRCRFCNLDPEIEESLRDEDKLTKQARERKDERERKEKAERDEKERKKAKTKIFLRNHRAKIVVSAVVICLLIVVAGVSAYASVPEKAFAVYSSSDKTLTFYKEKFVPKEGSSFKGKACTSVYEGVEDMTPKWSGKKESADNPGWSADHAEDIRGVSFAEKVTPISCRGWFTYLKNCSTFDLENLDTSKVTDFSYMFFDCSSVKKLDLSNFDTRNAVSFSRMFKECSSLTSIDLSSFDTEGAYNFDWMFERCSGLTALDVSSLDTSSATNLCGMFFMCEKLKSIDLKKFSTKNAKKISWMFQGCSSLEELDLSSFDTGATEDFAEMFTRCSKLKSIKGAESWNVSRGTDFELMFYKCPSLSLDCSQWDVSGLSLNKSDAFDRFNDGAPGVISPEWPASEVPEQVESSSSAGHGTSGYGGLGRPSGTSGTGASNPWK